MALEINKKIIANIRSLVADMVTYVDNGHPGSAMSMAHLFVDIYSSLNFDPTNPKHPLRDIVLLSVGHACPILYTFKYIIGHLELDDLKKFRQLNSKVPGHLQKSDYCDALTGSLGQGIAQSVGWAIALKRQGLDRKVVCVFGDGCYQEGVSQEAFAIANNLNLDNLIFVYDFNEMTIDGHTDLSMQEDVSKRFDNFVNFKVYNYQTHKVKDILNDKCVKMIIHKSVIGEGCRYAGQNRMHGFPLDMDALSAMKLENGLENEFFYVCDELKEFSQKLKELKKKEINKIYSHKLKFIKKYYKDKFGMTVHSDRNHLINFASCNSFGDDWSFYKFTDQFKEPCLKEKFDLFLTDLYVRLKDMPSKNVEVSNRVHLNDCLKMINYHPQLILGTADLTDEILIKTNEQPLTKDNYNGNYIYYGIREHAMYIVSSALSAFGYISFCGTYLSFIHYGYAAIRCACIDNLKVVYVFTHDSLWVGENGPTHQPTEALGLLRSTANLHVLRPCDEVEVRYSIWHALKRDGPTALILTFQPVQPVVQSDFSKCQYGAYFLKKSADFDLTILTSGSEVPLSLKISDNLQEKYKFNVVSFLSLEIFEAQSDEYKKYILGDKPRISIELSSTFGWHKYADLCIGLDCYGKSGKPEDLMEYFEFTEEKIGQKILDWLNKK